MQSQNQPANGEGNQQVTREPNQPTEPRVPVPPRLILSRGLRPLRPRGLRPSASAAVSVNS